VDAVPDPVARPPVALYVHVPFCVARCPYCDFVVYAGAEARGPRSRTGELFDALAVELELRADALDRTLGGPHSRPPLRSVYFGGGTPSLMPAERVAGLLALVRARLGLAADAEVTLEANPGPDERGELAALAGSGVNRISFGAQSFDAAELRRLGRRHSPDDIRAAVAAARQAGIPSISLDLLYEVPGQTLESWRKSLAAALALEPDHLSLYALTLDDPDAEGLTGEGGDHLPTPPGARRWRERARLEQDDDLAADEYEHASDVLEADGWDHYEISNWARPGRESRHNLVYWRRQPYEAIGPGAHAFDGTVRRWNAAGLAVYTRPLLASAPTLPSGGRETLDATTARAEELILGLRLAAGIREDEAETSPFAAACSWAEGNGLLERFTLDGEARVRLTPRGRLMSNELFARLV
jgi:putative oxygen-independent coproporphyrinogen III oxidase